MKALYKLEKQVLTQLEIMQKQYEQMVQKSLYDALVKIRGVMSNIYDKYAIDGKLSLAEMTQYNRYATMEKQMLGILDPALKQNLLDIKHLTPEMYDAAYFHYAWAIDNTSGLRLAWGVLDKNKIMENLANPIDKLAEEKYAMGARHAIRAALNKGLTMGKGYAAMVTDLNVAINSTAAQALRILRTEGQTAMNAGATDCYLKARSNGVDGIEIWDSTLDSKTRPTSMKHATGNHREMDQQKKGKDGFFYLTFTGEKAPYPCYSGLSAGQRINCRCHTRLEITGYSPQLRRSREEGVIPFQTYNEWNDGRFKPEPQKPLKIKDKLKTEMTMEEKIIFKKEKDAMYKQQYDQYMERLADKNNIIEEIIPKNIPDTMDDMVNFGNSLQRMQSLGGSTGAWQAIDNNGKNWVVKQYLNAQNPSNSAANEYIASQLYKEIGVDVPLAKLTYIDGKVAYVTEMLNGTELGKLPIEIIKDGVKQGFVADAYLANWDSIGLNADNILVANGKFYRIDMGGSLLYRAQGSPKGMAFGSEVKELNTLLDQYKNKMGAKYYSGITDEQIYAQIQDLKSKLNTGKIASIINNSSLDDALKGDLEKTLNERLKYLDSYANKLKKEIDAEKAMSLLPKIKTEVNPEAVTVLHNVDFFSSTHIADKVLKSHYNNLTESEKIALRNYTGAHYSHYIQLALKDDIDNKQYQDLVNAIHKLPKIDKPVLRGVSSANFSTALEKWKTGEWEEASFKGFSSSAFGQGSYGGGDLKFLILNDGTNLDHGLVGDLSAVGAGEKEVLINANTRYKVVGYSDNAYTRYVVLEPKPKNALPSGSQPPPKKYTEEEVLKIWQTGKLE
jgi:hypothetical protein